MGGGIDEKAATPESMVRVACLQFEPRIGETAVNVARSLELIEAAARDGADLVVLPELCNTGYMFHDRAQAHALAEPIPGGPSVDAWQKAAAEHDLYLCAGISERSNGRLYNSAVLLGPDGYIGTYRKAHLWNAENLYFEPGDLAFPVFHTPLGRLGMLICYDCWFPEAWRLLALQGADIVCVPTNWVPIPGQDPGREAMANILCMAAAHSNSVFVAAADRIGEEAGQAFIGQSLVVGYTGWPVAGPASRDREEIIQADCNLSDSRRRRNWNDFNQVLRDRRSDVYAEMLGANTRPGWY